MAYLGAFFRVTLCSVVICLVIAGGVMAAATDDFETGGLNKLFWWTHGDGQWSVSASSVHGGKWAAASPGLGSSQQASLDLPLNCADGSVSFWYAASSEASHGDLVFTIDGVEQGRWSGSVPWSPVTYTVAAGMHLFSWQYVTDASAGGTGGVFIDDISVPAATPPLTTSASPGGGTFRTPQSVSLYSSDTAAAIYYTVDGSTPTTASPVYSGPIAIATTTTLRFFAAGASEQERVKSVNYLFPKGESGAPSFAAPVITTLPNHAWSVATTDFDFDGKADLAVANREQNSVTVYRGNGDGTFTTVKDVGVGAQPTSITFARFNGLDSNPDIVVANSGGATAGVLLGNGSGDFSNLGSYATGTGTMSVAAGHFDVAGPPDMAVANYNTGYLNIYLGQGGGLYFNAPYGYYVGPGLMSVAVGDFNGDTKEDLAAVTESGNIVVMRGDGAGNFSWWNSYSSPQYARSIGTGDINGDGKIDLVVVSDGGDLPGGSATVSTFMGNGDGSFLQSTALPQPQFTSGVTIADFNSDGAADLALVNRSTGELSLVCQAMTLGVPVRSNQNVPIYYNSLQTALADAEDGKVIELKNGDLHENLVMDREVRVTLRGGVSGSFGEVSGFTTIYGSITISSGTLIVENLVIMP